MQYTLLWRKNLIKHRVRFYWAISALSTSLTQLACGQLQCNMVLNRPIAIDFLYQWTRLIFWENKINILKSINMWIMISIISYFYQKYFWQLELSFSFSEYFIFPILSKIEITIDFNGYKSYSYCHYWQLAQYIHFIRPCRYCNLKEPFVVL